MLIWIQHAPAQALVFGARGIAAYVYMFIDGEGVRSWNAGGTLLSFRDDKLRNPRVSRALVTTPSQVRF